MKKNIEFTLLKYHNNFSLKMNEEELKLLHLKTELLKNSNNFCEKIIEESKKIIEMKS